MTDVPTDAAQVLLNGLPVALPASGSLADVLAQASLDAHTHATAVNGQFVPREQRAAYRLQAGDVVTCFQAITGG